MIAQEVRAYIGRGIDFVKYASNDHARQGGAFLAFSPKAQEAIVTEAHRAGLTAQAHATSVEGLRIAVEAGCDLIQHANITGAVPIPGETLDLMAARKTGAVVFPFTRRALDYIKSNLPHLPWERIWTSMDANVRSLIGSGVPLLLANDGAILGINTTTDPVMSKSIWGTPKKDNLIPLDIGHFAWFRAMEEKGCAPMEMLRAATRNVAMAYGKDKDLGTLEAGKLADIVVLDQNPLLAAENYSSIHCVIKSGTVVDRDALPVKPLLTKEMAAAILVDASTR
jgi:imidazolonepropionase-like amidohydrolase